MLNAGRSNRQESWVTARNGHRVFDRPYDQLVVNGTDVRKLFGAAFPDANQVVRRIVAIVAIVAIAIVAIAIVAIVIVAIVIVVIGGIVGIIAEITGQSRQRLFRYDRYVKLFEEGT